MKSDIFKDFDTRYWQPKDRAWMAERELQWREVEKLLYGFNKSKKALGIIKRYFFKGALPDWDKLRDWDSCERHLDLMLFLYLHPSRDEAVLRPLRDAYMQSDQVLPGDITSGLLNLLRVGGFGSCSGGSMLFFAEDIEKDLPHLAGELESVLLSNQKPPVKYRKRLVLHTQHNNERLFGLMCPDPRQNSFHLPGEQQPTLMPGYKFYDIWKWSEWLIHKAPLNAGAQDMLFQYDLPLETWYCQCAMDEALFARGIINGPRTVTDVGLLLLALYRIYHFDQQQEGDSPRTRFVQKFSKMLDEREFVPGFQVLWEHVKSGGVKVKDAWTIDARVVSSALLDAARKSN